MRLLVLAMALGLCACKPRAEAPQEARPPAAPRQDAVRTQGDAPKSPEAQRLERGRYLVENVLACGACHSERDWTRYGGPVQGAPLSGACQDEQWGLPGRVCSPNITSDPEHGIGKWTDAELLRALREGFGRDGRVLVPMMPYLFYRELSDDDAKAVVAWLRQVPASSKVVARSSLPEEMMNALDGLASALPGPVPPPADDPVARGRYLTQVAQCAACHAGMDEAGTPFAGGRPMPTPYAPEVASNLTPHAQGLHTLSEEAFIARFTAFRDLAPAPSAQGQVNKLVMPWGFYAGLSQEDLRAMYRYLRTVPAAVPARAAEAP
ncbi:c-type cytochrome [Myxococcus xanthus]|uniref:c-type cytochrome n=1 Tax=Myxococcus xanthus TaxID=34 RepID=UPI00112747D9|nr:c-type cytochrome [Myxococcus xanthus]QDE81491.1 cytochrome C [Myxococcus xanthus]QDE95820.1 cytochrome C [Myxococcus xanthus]QDF03133.1 cytochrome C [Myxococcus xanthus]